MKEIKYIADSILGGITIEDDLIYELYKTKELKRLSRINHLGIVHFLYPMAMHFRFEHSLGVYELTRRAVHNLEKNGGKIDLLTKRTVMAAGLLHDLGHGPFSHLFEDVSPVHHEDYSIQIIADPSTEVYQAFEKIEPAAREGVIQILNGEHPIQWCNQLISSEIDMDRLDYLLRDSHSTGAAYGQVDWRWLLKNMRISEETNELVFKEKALPVIESMILGRFHMNVAVYRNPKNIANQRIYKFWFKRMQWLYENGKLKETYVFLEPILEYRAMTTQEFLNVDDAIVTSAIKYSSMYEEDEIVRTLADMFLRQKSPNRVFGDAKIEEFKKNLKDDEEGMTWIIENLDTNFMAYQKNHKFPAKILTVENEIKVATEYSTVISNDKNSEDRIRPLLVTIYEK